MHLSTDELTRLGFVVVEFQYRSDRWAVSPIVPGEFVRLSINKEPVAELEEDRYSVSPCRPGKIQVMAVDKYFCISNPCDLTVDPGGFVKFRLRYIDFGSPLKKHLSRLRSIAGRGGVFTFPVIGFSCVAGAILDRILWNVLPHRSQWYKDWFIAFEMLPDSGGRMTNEIATVHNRKVSQDRTIIDRDFFAKFMGLK